MSPISPVEMLAVVMAETLGTFFFLTVILTTGQAVPIGIALAAAITFGSFASGAHFNPAVTFMLWLKGDLPAATVPLYVVAQLAGGALALAWYNSKPRAIAAGR